MNKTELSGSQYSRLSLRSSVSILALLLGLFSLETTAMEAPNTDNAEAAAPEQVITTRHKPLAVLEKEIRDAEDKMYSIFNAINTDNMYDVNCEWIQPLGTRIRQRTCNPGFVKNASSQQSQQYFGEIVPGSSGATHAPSVQSEAEHHYPIYQEKLKAALEENEDFLAAVIQHYSLLEELKQRAVLAEEN